MLVLCIAIYDKTNTKMYNYVPVHVMLFITAFSLKCNLDTKPANFIRFHLHKL